MIPKYMAASRRTSDICGIRICIHRAAPYSISHPIVEVFAPAHRPTSFHRTRQPAQMEGNAHVALASEVQIPVHSSYEQASAHHISQRRRDQTLPDVVANAKGRPVPNADRDEEHVRDAMVQRQRHERRGREPDRYDLTRQLPRADAQEHRHAHQPVRADAPQEDLMPARYVSFRYRI